MSDEDPLKEDANSNFTEIPTMTLRLPIIGNFPAGGGHYMRFLPVNVLKAAMNKFNKKGFPAIFYIHPHDLDPAKPRVRDAAWHNYWGLRDATKKLQAIIDDYRFVSAREAITE